MLIALQWNLNTESELFGFPHRHTGLRDFTLAPTPPEQPCFLLLISRGRARRLLLPLVAIKSTDQQWLMLHEMCGHLQTYMQLYCATDA